MDKTDLLILFQLLSRKRPQSTTFIATALFAPKNHQDLQKADALVRYRLKRLCARKAALPVTRDSKTLYLPDPRVSTGTGKAIIDTDDGRTAVLSLGRVLLLSSENGSPEIYILEVENVLEES